MVQDNISETQVISTPNTSTPVEGTTPLPDPIIAGGLFNPLSSTSTQTNQPPPQNQAKSLTVQNNITEPQVISTPNTSTPVEGTTPPTLHTPNPPHSQTTNNYDLLQAVLGIHKLLQHRLPKPKTTKKQTSKPSRKTMNTLNFTSIMRAIPTLEQTSSSNQSSQNSSSDEEYKNPHNPSPTAKSSQLNLNTSTQQTASPDLIYSAPPP